jgi:hypothetical protein
MRLLVAVLFAAAVWLAPAARANASGCGGGFRSARPVYRRPS